MRNREAGRGEKTETITVRDLHDPAQGMETRHLWLARRTVTLHSITASMTCQAQTFLSARLQNILDCLRLGRPVTCLSLGFLQQHGLEALHRLATGALPYDSFRELALAEQATRIRAAAVARLAREAEDRARDIAMQARMKLAHEQAEAARLARESDPKYIAKVKKQQLRARYGVDTFVEQHYFGRLMNILECVDADQRLSQEDFVWL